MLAFLLVFHSLLCIKAQIENNNLGHLCDRSKCSDKYVIKYENTMNVTLLSKTYNITVAIGKEWTEMSILNKQARWIYCAAKTSVPWVSDRDSSVGVKNLPIDQEEAARMDKGFCTITKRCITDDCWGEASNICGNVEGTNQVVIGGYTIQMDCNNRNTFRGGCNQDFMCGKTAAKIRLFLAKDKGGFEKGNFYYVIKAPGKDKSYNVNKDVSFKNPDGSVSFVRAVNDPVNIANVEAHCYRDAVETVCRVTSSAPVSPGDTIRFGKSGVYAQANKIYFLNSDVDPVPIEFGDNVKTMSRADLESLFGVVEYVHMQSERNIMVLNNRVSLIGNAIINIVKSLGKIDDSLIGKIVGKESKTVWVSPDVFQQCSCTQHNSWDWDVIKGGANPCSLKTIPFQYVEGGYVRSTDSSSFMEKWIDDNKHFSCEINDANVHNMTFDWESTEFEYDHIYVPETTGSSSDWDGWTQIVADDERRNRENADTNSKNDIDKNNININPFIGIINLLSPYIPWAALIIAILAYLKN